MMALNFAYSSCHLPGLSKNQSTFGFVLFISTPTETDFRDCGSTSLPCNLKPRLAIGFVPTEFSHRQPSVLALLLDPPPTMKNATGDIRLMTGSVPLIALVVGTPPARRQKRGEKHAVL